MNIDIVAEKAELINELNIHLQKVPQSQLTFNVKGVKVVLQQLKLTKIILSLDKIVATIEIKVDVGKKMLLSDVSANGTIAIESYIDFTINETWQLQLNFHYSSHRWLDSPDVNIGLIQFSVKSIVDSVIDKQQDKIESTINLHLKSISDLSPYIRALLPYVNQSYKLQSCSVQLVPQLRVIIIKDITDTPETITIQAALRAKPSFSLTTKALERANIPKILIEKPGQEHLPV